MVSPGDASVWNGSGFLHELFEIAAPRASPRKLRLFAAACCRRVAPWMPGPLFHATLAVAERHADGLATDEELAGAEVAAFVGFAEERDRPAVDLEGLVPWSRQAEMANRALSLLASRGIYHALDCAANARVVPPAPPGRAWEAELREEAAQCDLLREVIGPAAYRPVRFDPLWALRDGAAALRLAEVIYHEEDWALMPFLADALEEAGCVDVELLTHARSGADHVRGCWALDLVLGKE